MQRLMASERVFCDVYSKVQETNLRKCSQSQELKEETRIACGVGVDGRVGACGDAVSIKQKEKYEICPLCTSHPAEAPF